MSSISATPNNETGSIALDITKTSDVLKVVRTNVNGSEEVRASEGQLPSTGVGGGDEVRRNLISNPSAETTTVGYQSVAGTGGAITTSQLFTGGAVSAGFFRVTWTTGNTGGNAGPAFLESLTGAAGDRFSTSLWVRSSKNRTVYLEVALNTSGVGNTWVNSGPQMLVANQWKEITLENFVANGSFNEVYYWVYADTANKFAAGDTMDLDGIILEKGSSVGPYFDGDSPGSGGLAYAWTGTPHASESAGYQATSLILQDYEAAHGLNTYNAYMGPEVRTNRHPNPVPGSTSLFTNSGGTGTWSYNTSEAEPFARFTKDAAANITTAFNTHSAVTIPAGSLVSFRAWVRLSYSSTVSVRNDGTAISGTATAVSANTWTEIKFNGYAIAGTTFRLTFLVSGFQPNATFDVRQALWELAPNVGEYFSGSTPDTADVVHAWTGTANASSSTETTSNVMVTGSATLTIDKPWLSVPVMPQYSEQVDTITAFGAGREANTTVHRPLGRADSLVVMGKLGDRTGSLEIFCDTYADARKLERIFERGEVVQLRQRVEGMDMYFTATSIPVSPYSVVGEDSTKWSMTINYVEVRRPIGDLAGALGWTFEELASSAASFTMITQSYATFDALTLGDANV